MKSEKLLMVLKKAWSSIKEFPWRINEHSVQGFVDRRRKGADECLEIVHFWSPFIMVLILWSLTRDHNVSISLSGLAYTPLYTYVVWDLSRRLRVRLRLLDSKVIARWLLRQLMKIWNMTTVVVVVVVASYGAHIIN